MMPLCLIDPNVQYRDDNTDICEYAQAYHGCKNSICTIQERLTIAEIRETIHFAYQSESLAVVYASYVWSGEVQNTLLKVLEEHSSSVAFVLIAPYRSVFLDTLVSRCRIVYVQETDIPLYRLDLYRQDYTQRMASIKSFQEDSQHITVSDILSDMHKKYAQSGVSRQVYAQILTTLQKLLEYEHKGIVPQGYLVEQALLLIPPWDMPEEKETLDTSIA